MWASHSARAIFGDRLCPAGHKCEFPNCLFRHDIFTSERVESEDELYNPAKRRKLDDSLRSSPPTEPADDTTVQDPSTASRVDAGREHIITKTILQVGAPHILNDKYTSSTENAQIGPKPSTSRSATKAISPPPLSKADEIVALVPRKLIKDPANFTTRLTLLKALLSYMKPHNDKLAKAVKPEVKALRLTANQLNRLAVDEEARIALDNPSVYQNLLKQRLVKLKKMTIEEWVKERREAVAKENDDGRTKKETKNIDTGLKPEEEITFLSLLVCPQDGLDVHGYVTQAPSEEDIEEARKTYIVAENWEVCDRCGTRFQVFQERREEDGAFTTAGPCNHHWGKRVFPRRTKDAVPEPTRFTCCNEPIGSPGCTTHETHVYNVKDPKRLALNMPFIATPDHDTVTFHTAVSFDCEMGYTTNGLELVRLTVISFPYHRPLIDILVKPLGHLLDINTRFSGITKEQFINAKPYDAADPKPKRKDLRIVDSPYAARNLFLQHVSPTTPILGHAIENDLNIIRLVHPTIIDTVLLYPTRQGLPYRHGLRVLAKKHLDVDIQQAGAAGHDSYEDARTTAELVRNKIKEKWRTLKADGWTVKEDGVYPPLPVQAPPVPAASMVPVAEMAVLEGETGIKRKFEGVQDGECVEKLRGDEDR